MAEEKTRHNAGWYMGVGAFWLIAAWLVFVGLSSIIPQIFGSAAQGSQSAEACAQALGDEKGALLSRLGAALALPGESRDALDAFLREWDVRVRALAETCPNRTSAAADELLRLRHGMRDAVAKLDREQGPRIQHFTTLLDEP